VVGCAAVGAEYSVGERRPEIGDLICGKYQITGVLGRGGMGVVFEAFHRVTEKRFALKWLLPELAESREGRRRFVREAKAASRLRHPGVVEIYDVEQEQGWFFLVMELLLGESLESRLARVGSLSIADGCRLLLPCMRAIAQAHAAGIIHRDLKPANLFLCSATDESLEFAKVLDFGISRMASDLDSSEVSLTQSGALMGTPNYMAPEQLCAGAIDHGADIYAFGVILYEAFAGRRPFAGVSLGELVLKVMSDTPPPLHQVNPDIDPRVSAIVHRALARKPEDRFESMSQFARSLELWGGTPPAFARSARVSSAPESVVDATPRRRSLASHGAALGLTGASAILVLICFAIAWRDSGPRDYARTVVEPEPVPVVIAAPSPVVGLDLPPEEVRPSGEVSVVPETKPAPVETPRGRSGERIKRKPAVPRKPDEARAPAAVLNPYRSKAVVARQADERAAEPSSSRVSQGQRRVGEPATAETTRRGSDSEGPLGISVDDF
jgi:serine/threonine protein kinase